LQVSAARLAKSFPHIDVFPVCADFSSEIDLPAPLRTPQRTVVYFPGSTIGNFTPEEASEILDRIACLAGRGGGLLVGIDLVKSTSILEAAYNDARGVTAEFNLNLLRRINRELGANCDLRAFKHRAHFNPEKRRIEIFLVSQREQTVSLLGEEFHFAHGEAILTEYSHKYTVDGFAQLAAEAGFRLRRAWTDDQQWFAVLYLEVTNGRHPN
jgi:dimethylhistidine N-methyltransferase